MVQAVVRALSVPMPETKMPPSGWPLPPPKRDLFFIGVNVVIILIISIPFGNAYFSWAEILQDSRSPAKLSAARKRAVLGWAGVVLLASALVFLALNQWHLPGANR